MKRLLFGVLLVLLLLAVGCGSGDVEETIESEDNASEFSDAASDLLDKVTVEQEVDNDCPYECCTKKDDYDVKSCEFDKPCVENRCRFEDCPSDCCSGYGKYLRKKCDEGYECLDSDCIAIDDDQDKLLNIEEDELGTDPDDADSDDDGLSDYEEVRKIKTDPLDENTDGDRYLDGEDPNPLVAVYPDVTVELEEGRQSSDEDNLQTLQDAYVANCQSTVCSVDDILPITGDLELFTVPFTIERKNNGDDYTEYTEFKIIIYTIDGGKLRKAYPTIEERMDRLETDEKDSKDYEIVIMLSDLGVGGESVLASAALESPFILLPEVKNLEVEGQ